MEGEPFGAKLRYAPLPCQKFLDVAKAKEAGGAWATDYVIAISAADYIHMYMHMYMYQYSYFSWVLMTTLSALPLEMVVAVMTALSAADMAHAAESCSVCRIALERAVRARAHLHRLSLEASRPWLQLSPFERIRMPWSFLLRVAEVRPRVVVAVSGSAASTFNLRCNTHTDLAAQQPLQPPSLHSYPLSDSVFSSCFLRFS